MNKTKFFSSLLVAVLFATTSVFVSCKDYDDDIKNLQSQIDKAALKADLDALSTKLAGAESTANAAKTTAENALAKANANATEIAAVKTTAEKAAKDAAEGLVAVAKAQNTADAAAAAAAAAQKTADDAAAAAAAAQKTADEAKALGEAAATKAELAAAKKELDDAIDKLQKAVDNLDAVKATKVELADAKTELKAYTDAAKEAALAAAKLAADAAAAAQSTADAATAAAGTAQSTADKNAEAITGIKNTIEKLATQTALETLSKDLNDEITGLKNTLAAITGEEQMAELVKIVGSFDTIVEKLFSAVTSVELIASYSGTPDATNEAISFPLGRLINGGGNVVDKMFKLDFVFGKQKWTDKFGDKEDRFADADQIIEYTEGVDIRAKQALLVRVNPVNATFTKDQVKLIDSKGRNLDEIITIGEPYRFEGLITRGNTTETGLWVIPVSVVENTKLKDFNLITFNEREYFATEEEAKKKGKDFETEAKEDGAAIAYAVAINNTADEAEGRFVASTYDLSAEYTYFTPASDFYFNLETKDSDGKEIAAKSYNVHNRWTDAVWDFGDDQPGIQSKDQHEAHTLLNPEQMWVAIGDLTKEATDAGYVTPASAAKKESDKLYNTVNDIYDYRFYNPYFTIEKVGQKITVSLPDDFKKKAEYWYITYDFQANAVESAPSEWEAWQSYKSEIKGIYTMTRGAEDIDLVINAAAAQGDVIGFRVFAVNYDGSLLDPDGKAFYVKVGDIETIKKELTAEVLALDPTKDMSTETIKGFKNLKREDGVNYGYAELADGAFESLSPNWYGANQTTYSGTETRNGITLYWVLLQKDKETVADNWNNIKYLAVGVKGESLKDWLNGSTITFKTYSRVRNDANAPVQYQLVLKAKKVMPTAANIPEAYKFIWKPDYDPAVKNALNVYAIPTADALNPVTATVNNAKMVYWQGSNGKLIGKMGTADYTHSATTGERKIEDYVSGEFLANDDAKKLYNFSIEGLPTGLTGSDDLKNYAYQTAWNGAPTNVEGDSTIAQVLPAAIGNNYPTKMKFIFKGISATKDKNKNWTADYDYPVVAQTFTTAIKNPIDLLTYSTEYTYPVYKMNADGSVYYDANNRTVIESRQTSDKIYIKWVTDKLADVTTVKVTNVYGISSKQADYLYNTTSTLLGMIKLNSSAANIVLANDAAKLLSASTLAGLNDDELGFQTGFYNINNPATTEAEKLTFEFTGNVGKYIVPVDAADLTQGFKKKGGANNPTENMEGTVKITGYDCYGKKHEFEFPVVILFDK